MPLRLRRQSSRYHMSSCSDHSHSSDDFWKIVGVGANLKYDRYPMRQNLREFITVWHPIGIKEWILGLFLDSEREVSTMIFLENFSRFLYNSWFFHYPKNWQKLKGRRSFQRGLWSKRVHIVSLFVPANGPWLIPRHPMLHSGNSEIPRFCMSECRGGM